MDKEIRNLWRSATTLADLGELTAAALEGTVPQQPGWGGESGIAPETRTLVPTLAALCRAGFVTTSSQPGFDDSTTVRPDGQPDWQQRAAVQGYTDALTLEWLTAAIVPTRFQMVIWTIPRHPLVGTWILAGLNTGVAVTREHGADRTWFGRQVTEAEIASGSQNCLSRAAISTICSAFHVLIFDPLWLGDDDLWPVLRRAAQPRQGRPLPVRRRPARITAAA